MICAQEWIGANMKERLKSYSFWMAILSAILIFVQTLGAKIDMQVSENIINAFLGIFVVLGVIDKPKSSVKNITNNERIETKDNIKCDNFDAKENLTDAKNKYNYDNLTSLLDEKDSLDKKDDIDNI